MRGVDLTTGSVLRHLIAFSLPMLMGSALQAAYSIINAIWVGNGLGAEAMAALTVSFPIFFLLMAVAGGLTLASNILVSQAFGAKDHERLRQVIQNSLILTAAVSLLCLMAGVAAAEPILRAMNTPADVLPEAVSYLRLFLLSTPFMFAVYYQAAIMRGVGDSRSPLYFQALSLVVTALLDPVLMFGWLGMPRMGLNGTAVATIVAQAFAFVSIAVYAQRREHIAAPDWRNLRLDLPMTLLTARIGIPSMVQQALVSLGMLFIVGFVNGFGTHSSAAFGIAMRIDQLAFMPAMTVGMAVSTLAGQNIGAGRFDRVRNVFWGGVAIALALTALASVPALVVPTVMMRMFTHDADVILIGAHYLRIVGFGYLLFAVMFVANGVINGSGQTGVTTALSLIGFWAVRVPLAAYLSARLQRVEGIWYGILASIAIGTVLSFGYYASGRWKHKVLVGSSSPTLAEGEEAER